MEDGKSLQKSSSQESEDDHVSEDEEHESLETKSIASMRDHDSKEKIMTLANYKCKKSDNMEESSIVKQFRERRENRVQLWKERSGDVVEHFYKKKGDDKVHLYLEYITPEGKKLRSWKECVKHMGEDPSRPESQATKSSKQVKAKISMMAAEGGHGKANRSSSRKRLPPSSSDEDETDNENSEYKVRRSCDTSDEASEDDDDKHKHEFGKHSKKYEHIGNGKQKLETNPGKDKDLRFLEWMKDTEAISDVEKVNFKKELVEMQKPSTRVASTAETGSDTDLERPKRWRPKKKAVSGTNQMSEGQNVNDRLKAKSIQMPSAKKVGRTAAAKDGRTKFPAPVRSEKHHDLNARKASTSLRLPDIQSARSKKKADAEKKSVNYMQAKKTGKKKKLAECVSPNLEANDSQESSSHGDSMIEGIRKAYKVARTEEILCKCKCSGKKPGSRGSHCCCLTVFVLRKCVGVHAR